MNRNKRIISRSNAVETIPAGLAKLALAYQDRNADIEKIILKRGREIYEYAVNETTSDIEMIQAQFRSVVIIVSCIAPLNSETREILQSRTHYAAIAAVDWIAVPTQLAFLQTNASDAEKSNGTSEQSISPGALNSLRLIGTSTQVMELVHNARRAANSNHVVLILGESGTGKTTVASMIHDEGQRASKPFVEVNCAAVPETLIESELFGYEKGAFTSAVARKRGLFEAANEGTLFLDEIGELKLELQAKLLTAIEQRKIRRLGGTHQINCDVRIVAASSRDLQEMVAEGTFREDLYYRLAVLEITVPPLREHREDIPLLVRSRLANERNSDHTAKTLDVGDEAMNELMAYDWPGNVRQLHNVIARLCVQAEVGGRVTGADVRKQLGRFNAHSTNGALTSISGTILLPMECRKLLPGESIQQFTARVKQLLIRTVEKQAAITME
jgi:transcriptional regulator with PAS, ATPase and Fis domain